MILENRQKRNPSPSSAHPVVDLITYSSVYITYISVGP